MTLNCIPVTQRSYEVLIFSKRFNNVPMEDTDTDTQTNEHTLTHRHTNTHSMVI